MPSTDAQVEPEVREGPLVSVVISFLDAERFLRDAVESVLAQSYRNWELLLVDDGSTDGGTEVAMGFAESEPDRIRYLEHPGHLNRGIVASRNLGTANARGEFVAFLDADDVFLPFKLERQVPLLLSNPEAGMIVGNTLFWHSPGGAGEVVPDGVPEFAAFGLQHDRVYLPPVLLTRLLENEDSHPAICSLLVRRSLCIEVGGFDDLEPDLYEDSTLLAKAYLTAPVFLSGDCSSVYRIQRASRSQTLLASGEYRFFAPNPARGAFLEWLDRHLAQQQVADSDLLRAIDLELIPYRNPSRCRRVRAGMRTLRRRALRWARARTGRR